MVECLVPDCQHVDREKWICQVEPDDLKHDQRGNCMNYLRDMKWLKKQWRYKRVLDNDKLVDEIQLLLLAAANTSPDGLSASEIQQELLDQGVEASTQKIVNLIRHRGEHIDTHPISNGSKWSNMYCAAPPLLEVEKEIT